jgi:hypothetical protein
LQLPGCRSRKPTPSPAISSISLHSTRNRLSTSTAAFPPGTPSNRQRHSSYRPFTASPLHRFTASPLHPSPLSPGYTAHVTRHTSHVTLHAAHNNSHWDHLTLHTADCPQHIANPHLPTRTNPQRTTQNPEPRIRKLQVRRMDVRGQGQIPGMAKLLSGIRSVLLGVDQARLQRHKSLGRFGYVKRIEDSTVSRVLFGRYCCSTRQVSESLSKNEEEAEEGR